VQKKEAEQFSRAFAALAADTIRTASLSAVGSQILSGMLGEAGWINVDHK
jgi:hypothetical protein